jgi:PAS domain S-box-containing protein
MITSLVDHRPPYNVPFTNVIEKIFSDTNTGWLIADSNLTIISFNAEYNHFYQLYAKTKLAVGELLKDEDFVLFPEIFSSSLKQIAERDIEKSKFQIDYLGNGALLFSISMVYVVKEDDNFEGLLIVIQKSEAEPFTFPITESEDFFKLLVDTSTSVYQLTDATLVSTYTSESVQNLIGYSPDELLGKSVIDFVHPQDKEHVRDWFFNSRKQPGKVVSCEYRLKSKSGAYIWIENNARNMLGNSNINAIVMNFRNIQEKKAADEALVQAEQRLSLLLNNTAESFILLNSRLRIVTYNRAAQNISPFFYSQELQSGISVLDLISKDEILDYLNLFEQVFKGSEIERQSKFVDSNKNARVYSHSFRPLFNEQYDIQGVFITSGEITERTRLTEEIAIHADRLKIAQTIARLGYIEYDTRNKTIFCSELFYEILDLPHKIETYQQLSELLHSVHSADKKAVDKEIGEAVSHGKDFNLEFRLNGADGNTRFILAIGGSEKSGSGEPIKFRVTLQDITDSKMAVLALQALESKFKLLFENSIDGVILSKEDGEIVSANPAVCKILGYCDPEILHLKICDLFNKNCPDVDNVLKTHKDTGSYTGELILKHKDGFTVPVEVTSISMKDENDDAYISTIIRDITEKKKIEREQKSLTEELLKNNQDLQQFSFITSHNLRAPIANLLSLLSLYNKENPLDEFNQLLIEKSEEAAQQLNQTLNDLLNVLVIKSNTNVEREIVSFSNVFITVKKNIDNLLQQQKGVIHTDFSVIDEFKYNRIHLESIFLNMLSNAIRYSSPDRIPIIKINSYKTENWVVVEFEDNGLGMDLDRYRDRLFGLYQRFHDNIEGKGLGLYMTRSQITAMGGKIEVESQLGIGTKFKIYFKLQD